MKDKTMTDKTYVVVKRDSYKNKFIVIDKETGKILDDAQGYGYKTVRNAYACFAYKNMNKEQKKGYEKRKQEIAVWIKTHSEFMNELECEMFDALKNNEQFTEKDIQRMLIRDGYDKEITAKEILKNS